MQVSPGMMKWIMRFYPPLLFQGIWTIGFHEDYRGVDVKIIRSLMNMNYNKSIFGGTIYAAADPFYAVLLHQLLSKRGYKLVVWQKAADIDFIKPGYGTLRFSIRISDDELAEVCSIIDKGEKCIKSFPITIMDKSNEVCAKVNSVVYVRKRI